MGLDVHLHVAPTEEDSKIEVGGAIQRIVTDVDRKVFKLEDEALKALITKHKLKRPDDAFLHSPTPWDVYEKERWSQTKTVLKAVKGEILGITSEPVIIKTQTFTNDSTTHSGTYSARITDSVDTTVSSGWTTGGTLTVSEGVTVKATVFGTGIESETKVEYSQAWGVSGGSSTRTHVGSSSAITVTLAPGQKVLAELSTSRGSLKARVTYSAMLAGDAAYNYADGYEGHHFYRVSMGTLADDYGVPQAIVTTQDIEVGYYSNAKVTLKDADDGTVIDVYDVTEDGLKLVAHS